MKHWTELRSALMVARYGTVSAAASELGVHRATVNRHIETLESALNARLFHRHAQGYTLTDAGQDMMEIAGRAEEMFIDLEGRSRGRESLISGRLVFTSLSGVAPLIVPALAAFQKSHPNIDLEFIAEARLARLEHGEAHVAFRVGAKPDFADYVVLPFKQVHFSLYASTDYIARYGMPKPGEYEGHRFVGAVGLPSPVPFMGWMTQNVDPEALALRTTNQYVIQNAVCAGLGLGFLAEHDVEGLPELVKVLPSDQTTSTPLWIVTHVDLHRTGKIQEFLRFTKAIQD
ncbi:LysR family transcriptional regulator [Roseibium denhamense]|uniref:Transcriptional regulator, LysR family n=1 Tax=Roseibium denhamense TaxID=76305 RepID=A0ABY1PPS2_9HYPH|nr:LysR family transcriptional regulator [Roseibium denhamense]MTI04325.1 LysR family transcriptional regulator [Roseibium denhamense]SMP37232.1 transcriptional regulator, LysR family [Roseibium denhamense]